MIESSSVGWRASLALRFAAHRGRTHLAERKHQGPLMVQRAFYPEAANVDGEPCHVYLIHPPGGVASGDSLEIHAALDRGAHALLTTPAAGKFYRRGSAGWAYLRQTLCIDDATLEWLPQENIYYPDAAVELSTVVQLSERARFIGWEIGCFGLPTHGRTLEFGMIRQRFELWLSARPLFIERLTIDEESMAAVWGLAGHASAGTWIGYPAGPDQLAAARRAAHDGGCAGVIIACTLVGNVLMCKAVAPRADRLREAFITLWRALRPAVIGRAAILPRVWAT